MDPTQSQTNLAAALAAGAAMSAPRTPDGCMPYVIVPEGATIENLEERSLPSRPKGLVKLRDAASFIAYFTDHQVERSRIYATLEPAAFLAVFDEFDTAVEVGDITEQADWREFRASFVVPPSREWLTWTGQNRKPMSQVAFAEFVLDNLPDVVNPDGSTLYDAAVSFEASSAGRFKSAVRLQDGSHNFQWVNENRPGEGGTIKLPDMLELAVPVFENALAVTLQARLRYRVKDDSLSIWFELVRPHKVLEVAFRALWNAIEEATGRTLLLGSPE